MSDEKGKEISRTGLNNLDKEWMNYQKQSQYFKDLQRKEVGTPEQDAGGHGAGIGEDASDLGRQHVGDEHFLGEADRHQRQAHLDAVGRRG